METGFNKKPQPDLTVSGCFLIQSCPIAAFKRQICLRDKKHEGNYGCPVGITDIDLSYFIV